MKEKIFWRRTIQMKNKLNFFWFILAVLLISIGHYAFALMHILFESYLWIIRSDQFKKNLEKSYIEIVKTSKN